MSVLNKTNTPGRTTPLPFCTVAVRTVAPALPATDPSVTLVGTVVDVGAIGEGASGA